jgi:hypothetical protein
MISPSKRWLGAALLVAGLTGHLVSAYSIRANPRAFPDHLAGFFGIAAVTGVIIAALGWFFWRSRRDITWLIFCSVQAIIGLVVLLMTINGFH